ncbi:MAG: AsmA-like C-terminal region-containing protein [Gemmataceae bacterium]|nr:AsmA-like C-terminal region-containing protein [Gemmataceae bacterium]
MAWHKWFVRGLVFSLFASAVLATLAYQHWTNPAAVRLQVLAKTLATFPGGLVTVDAASLRILGGIQVRELHLSRRDDPTAEVAHIPSAILYHNKEKMLDGELSFRKIELYRPRLRVIRGTDGVWNVQGLAAAAKPGQAYPTVVVHEATIHFEDHSRPDVRPFKLELTRANLTLINDPLDVVTIDGVAQAELLGRVIVHGTWQREANEVTLSIRTIGTRLNDVVAERLACCCPEGRLNGLRLQGRANVHVNMLYRPASEQAWSVNVHCQVAQTKIQHPELPLPLDNVEASIRWDGDELRLESLRASAGPATVTGQGVGRLACLEEHFEATLRLEQVEVDDDLGARLPEKLRPLMERFQPRGRIRLQFDVCRRDGAWTTLADGTPSRVTALPVDVSACFERFPYPLRKISGAVQFLLPQQRLLVDLTAHAGGRPVLIKGHWQGQAPRIDMQYDISADAVPVDATLIGALREPMRSAVESFQVGGLVDVKAHVRRRPVDDDFHAEYHLRLHQGAAVWTEFPYPLTKVSGFISVTPTAWEFRDFEAWHGAGLVKVHACSRAARDRGAVPGIYVEITGKDILFDADLHNAVRAKPGLAKAWATFQPSGRLNFTATIERRGPQPEDVDVRVDVKGPNVRPIFFPYPLADVAGHFHFRDQRLELRRLCAKHGDARWYLEKGTVEVHPGGAFYADLPDLQAEQLLLDRDLLGAFPPKLRAAAAALRLRDPLRVKTRLVIADSGGPDTLPDVYWDGQAWLTEATLTVGLECSRVTGAVACVGRHNGRHLTGLCGNLILERAAVYNQPFRNVQGHFHVQESMPELMLLDLKAPIFGGDVAGQVSLDFRAEPRFELNLTASQINLEEFGRHNLDPDRLAGLMMARVYLTGTGNDPATLNGHGTLDIPNGKLLNLPFLLDLIKFLGLRWPDRTMFEELHARYAIQGRRAFIHELELFGNAVSFTGKGEINLDGTDLRLDMYPSWARFEQLLPPAVRSMPPNLTKNLLTVEARGKISGDGNDIRFTKKPVPILIDPLLHLRDRLVGPPVPDLRRPVQTSRPVLPRLSRLDP